MKSSSYEAPPTPPVPPGARVQAPTYDAACPERGGNPSTFLLGKKQDFSFRKVSVEGLNKVAGPMVMQGYAQISGYVILYYSTKSKQDNAKRKSNLAPHNHLLCLPYAIY